MPSHSVNVPNEWMATDTLSGLVGFLLLPLFHLQLFFFLLESMGGSGFIACVGWALVPSITTRWADVSSLLVDPAPFIDTACGSGDAVSGVA